MLQVLLSTPRLQVFHKVPCAGWSPELQSAKKSSETHEAAHPRFGDFWALPRSSSYWPRRATRQARTDSTPILKTIRRLKLSQFGGARLKTPLGYNCRNSTAVLPFWQLSFGSHGLSLSFAFVRGLCWISMGGSRNAFGIFQSPLPLIQGGCLKTMCSNFGGVRISSADAVSTVKYPKAYRFSIKCPVQAGARAAVSQEKLRNP